MMKARAAHSDVTQPSRASRALEIRGQVERAQPDPARWLTAKLAWQGGAGHTVSSSSKPSIHGRVAMIFRYSSSVKAREVSDLIFPIEALARATRATASSFGISETAIASYCPMTT